MMFREPENGGFNFWMTQLQTHAWTRYNILVYFSGSLEFQNNCRKHNVNCGHL